MYLEATCVNISQREWDKYMKRTYKVSYKNIVNKIKKELPELYFDLDLGLNNPFKEQCRQSKEYYILVHSAIEYFIRKD